MTTPEVADAYDRAVAGWCRGPEAVYARFAEALLAHAPVDVSGARVLDVGAGTAVAGRAAIAAGAREVVASDISVGMLHRRGPGISGVCADAGRLPFSAGSFDLALAGLCLGHLPDPTGALVEIRRVAAGVAASAFAPGWTHPAKAVVDQVMTGLGFAVPFWYDHIKQETEPVVNDPQSLERLARDAGFAEVRVRRVEVDSGLRSPAEVVDWRFGMAHLAPFVAGLSAADLSRARAAAEEAVAGSGPVVVPLLILSAS